MGNRGGISSDRKFDAELSLLQVVRKVSDVDINLMHVKNDARLGRVYVSTRVSGGRDKIGAEAIELALELEHQNSNG
ncbi:hypothetical protein Bca4012_082696 [Brassica carinata]